MKKFINDNMTWIVGLLVVVVGFIIYKSFSKRQDELPDAGTEDEVAV